MTTKQYLDKLGISSTNARGYEHHYRGAHYIPRRGDRVVSTVDWYKHLAEYQELARLGGRDLFHSDGSRSGEVIVRYEGE